MHYNIQVLRQDTKKINYDTKTVWFNGITDNLKTDTDRLQPTQKGTHFWGFTAEIIFTALITLWNNKFLNVNPLQIFWVNCRKQRALNFQKKVPPPSVTLKQTSPTVYHGWQVTQWFYILLHMSSTPPIQAVKAMIGNNLQITKILPPDKQINWLYSEFTLLICRDNITRQIFGQWRNRFDSVTIQKMKLGIMQIWYWSTDSTITLPVIQKCWYKFQ